MRFGIVSPLLGQRTDVPSIALSEAYSGRNADMEMVNGELNRTPKRQPHFLDAAANNLAAPRYALAYAITGAHVFTVPGNYESQIPAGTRIGLNGSAADDDLYTLDTAADDGTHTDITIVETLTPSTAYAITGVNQGTKTFTVAGDHHSDFAAHGSIVVLGSTGNDDEYTVVSATFDVDHTDIVVSEAIADATVDGNLYASDGLLFVGTTPIIRYHSVDDGAGAEYLFAFTAYNVFRWIAGTNELLRVWTVAAAGGCTYWDTVTFNGKLVAVNFSDAVLSWDSADSAAPLAIIAAASGYVARFVAVYENHVILGYRSEGGNTCPSGIRWSKLGDETDWTDATAGDAIVAGAGAITGGFAPSRGYLLILKQCSIQRMWMVTSDDIWNIAEYAPGVGCEAPGSVVIDGDGEVYFYATDRYLRGVEKGPISQLVDSELRSICYANLIAMRAQYMPSLDEIWWAMGDAVTATNNVVRRYKRGIWNTYDAEVSAFGRYRRYADMGWADLPWDNWDDWPWDHWFEGYDAAGYPLDLVGDYSGYTYEPRGSNTDNGEDFEGWFELDTDLTQKEAPTVYKRLHSLQAYVRPEPETYQLTIDVKCDAEPTWRRIATEDVAGDAEYVVLELPTDYRAKFFRFRVSAERHYHFLGLVFDFDPVGAR
jgi:hypothetical protein